MLSNPEWKVRAVADPRAGVQRCDSVSEAVDSANAADGVLRSGSGVAGFKKVEASGAL